MSGFFGGETLLKYPQTLSLIGQKFVLVCAVFFHCDDFLTLITAYGLCLGMSDCAIESNRK